MKKVILILQESSKDLSEKAIERLMDITLNGVNIEPARDSVPAAWDASFSIEKGNFIVHGAFAPSGFGKVTIELPLKAVDGFYAISCDVEEDNVEEVLEIFSSSDWVARIE